MLNPGIDSPYYEALVDLDQQIPAATVIDELPDNYKCWTCSDLKADFHVAVLEKYSRDDG